MRSAPLPRGEPCEPSRPPSSSRRSPPFQPAQRGQAPRPRQAGPARLGIPSRGLKRIGCVSAIAAAPTSTRSMWNPEPCNAPPSSRSTMAHRGFKLVNRAVDVSGSRGGGTSVSVGGSSGSYGSGLGVGVGFGPHPRPHLAHGDARSHFRRRRAQAGGRELLRRRLRSQLCAVSHTTSPTDQSPRKPLAMT